MEDLNRIMLGEHGKYLHECLEGEYIGINFLSDSDLSDVPIADEATRRKHMIDKFLLKFPEKPIGTARKKQLAYLMLDKT